MKAKLTFDLNDFDDKMSHNRCIKSLDLCLALFAFGHNTRKEIRNHIEQNETLTPYEAVDLVYDKFWEIMRENNIDLEELIN